MSGKILRRLFKISHYRLQSQNYRNEIVLTGINRYRYFSNDNNEKLRDVLKSIKDKSDSQNSNINGEG